MQRLKFGLEKEMFVMPNGTENNPILVPNGIPKDECGYLAEARGLPSNDIVEAVYSLKAAEYKIETALHKIDLIADDVPILKLPRELFIAAQRSNVKGLIKYNNYYGYQHHKNKHNEAIASVHISFTCPKVHCVDQNTNFTYNQCFDYIRIFKALDKAFAQEIKEAKRLPGFYEVKPDGRIEYRSLPSNVDLSKLIEVIDEITKNNNVLT